MEKHTVMTREHHLRHEPSHFILPIAGLPVHVFISGIQETAADAPLIVLVHGAGGDHCHFDSLLPILVDAGYRVLTMDLPYHGRSQGHQTQHNTAFDFTNLSELLTQILGWYIQHARPRRTPVKLYLGGLSMGGMLIQTAYRLKYTIWHCMGYHVSSIVPISCGAVNLLWPRMTWMDYYRTVDAMDTQIIEAARLAIAASAIHEEARQEAARSLKLVTNETLFRCLQACAMSLPDPTPPDTPARFDGDPIKIPQLLLFGEHDEYVKEIMETWHALNIKAGICCEYKVVHDSGHMVPLDQGPLAAQFIVDFLSSLQD